MNVFKLLEKKTSTNQNQNTMSTIADLMNDISWPIDLNRVGKFIRSQGEDGEQSIDIVDLSKEEMQEMVPEESIAQKKVRATWFCDPETIEENSVYGVVQAVRKAMDKKCNLEDKRVKERIDMFFEKEPLEKALKEGTLTNRELVGDHRYFEGLGPSKSDKTIYVLHLGS